MQVPHGLTAAQLGVLRHLKQSGNSNAKRIAAALGVTPPSVRNHLTILKNAGFVAVSLERQGAGRPSHVYSLTDKARSVFPNDYEGFVGSFIRAATELLGEEKLESIFKRMQTDAKARYSLQMADKELEDRVAEMARILTDSGYMAEWRRIGEDTFELTERNCSLWPVANQCPEVCRSELSLIRQLLGGSVERREHIIAGDSVCRYRIERTPPPQEKDRMHYRA